MSKPRFDPNKPYDVVEDEERPGPRRGVGGASSAEAALPLSIQPAADTRPTMDGIRRLQADLVAANRPAPTAPGGKPKFDPSQPFDPVESAPAERPPQWSDVPMNAVKDVRDIAAGLPVMAALLVKKNITLPSDVTSSMMDVARGKDIRDTVLGRDIQKFIEMQKGTVAGIREEVAHPIESFKKRPVSTAADIAGVALPLAGSAAKFARGASGTVGKRLMSATLGPSLEKIEARLVRNAQVRNSDDFSQLADQIPDAMTVLEGKLKTADKAAWDTLKTSNDPMEGAFPKTDIVEELKKVRREIPLTGGGAVGKARKRAISEIDDLIADVEGVGANVRGKLTSQQGVKSIVPKKDFVSEARMREVIQAARENVRYEDEGASVANEALKGAAAKLDGLLKTKNPAYAEKMVPLAAITDVFEKIKRDFSIKNVAGKGLIRENATVEKLRSVTSDRKDVSRKNLQSLGEMTGKDFVQGAEDAATAAAFEGGRAQGSRRVNLGTLLGGAVGGTIGGVTGGGSGGAAGATAGAVAGGMMGAYLDTQGAKIAGGIIDWYIKNKPEELARFADRFLKGTSAVGRRVRPVAAGRVLSDQGNRALPVRVMKPSYAQ